MDNGVRELSIKQHCSHNQMINFSFVQHCTHLFILCWASSLCCILTLISYFSLQLKILRCNWVSVSVKFNLQDIENHWWLLWWWLNFSFSSPELKNYPNLPETHSSPTKISIDELWDYFFIAPLLLSFLLFLFLPLHSSKVKYDMKTQFLIFLLCVCHPLLANSAVAWTDNDVI